MSSFGGGRLRRNAVYSVAGLAIPNMFMLVLTPVLLRQMGTTDYGLWQIALAAFGFLGIVELGLGTAIAKFIAEQSARGDIRGISATVTLALGAYVLLGALVTPVVELGAGRIADLFSSWQEPHHLVSDVVRLVALGVLPLLLLSAGLGIAAGLQRFEIPMIALVAQNALTLLAAVIVAGSGGSVLRVILSSLVVLWATGVVTLTYCVRALCQMGARPLWVAEYARETASYVGVTSLTSVGIAVFGTLDRIVVGAVLGLKAVSYYTVSIGIANKLLAFADVLTRPLLPASSADWGVGRQAVVRSSMLRWTRAVASICLPVAAILFVTAKPLLSVWIGHGFAASALSTFRILVVVYAIVAVAAPAYHVANGIGLAALCAACAVVGGGATIGLIVAIGPSSGVAGAAAANSAYVVNLAIPIYLLKKLRVPK